ncbi:hypothetical protein GMORB2_0816 [Geosmithia morbida]|uniref:BZIP domain-containing protein n=1 Tax=Geosmithia morbida TaxID=1094350 RepID=A0A9P4Z1A2_9HYPO|nr:uncharacterized protein GMORB2_0816 [Geosmithia morbida]KAF4125572.1 hypothetical protein GMORB2_0816 [Geosmithia morbida]
MASAGTGGSVPPQLFLTPQQQSLLFAALESGKNQPPASQSASRLNLSPGSFQGSPIQQNDVRSGALEQSPYLDSYNYDDLGDSSFDFSYMDEPSKTSVDRADTSKSDSTDADFNEKRSHPEDEDDEEGGDLKRHESDKVPKKPGRKPLMSEPSSKRKAQNRAAQRAFRERKEKHLKDLETKVDELAKASEAANNENARLRAQVDRMTTELKHYKQRMSASSSQNATAAEKAAFGSSAVNHLNDVNFQFNFPKFGVLPGPPQQDKQQKSPSQPVSPQLAQSPAKSQASGVTSRSQPQPPQPEDFGKFNGLYTPSMTSSSARNGSGGSIDSVNYSAGGATSSPSSSSHSNTVPSSSCGTSPEPLNQSPSGAKPMDTMTTIGEEHPSMSNEPFAQFANVDFGNSNSTNFDWLAQQHGGNFDPQLFTDYRETQDQVLSNNPSFDDFFNDALDADFFTPYNVAASPNFGATAADTAPKKSLIEEIDAQKNDYDDKLVISKENVNCAQLWYVTPLPTPPPSGPAAPAHHPATVSLTPDYRERLQSCPKSQSGEFDLDGLCSELTKKAKCSGTGPIVAEHDFDTILKKYMGKGATSDCVASTLGVHVKRDASKNSRA